MAGRADACSWVHRMPSSRSSAMATSDILLTSGVWSRTMRASAGSTTASARPWWWLFTHLCRLSPASNISSVGFFLVTISSTNTPKLYTSPFVVGLEP
uniref:Uncharacterized protein n=1 Tax=Arundo donax TaxID=35708 RepID=A0A0A9HU33_ARUDO